MIKVLLSERIIKTVGKLPPDLRDKAAKVLSRVPAAFGTPHRHRGLGMRKLASRSYEVHIHLQWRIIQIHDGATLVAYDIMDHDGVARWLRGRRESAPLSQESRTVPHPPPSIIPRTPPNTPPIL